MNRLYCLVFALVATSTSGWTQSLEGYHRGPVVALPEYATDSLVNGQFTLLIDRQTNSDSEREALEIAESVFPDIEQIERAAALETRPRAADQLNRAALIPGDRWWWIEFDGVLTPYAVTGASVAYYADRLRERAAGPNPSVQVSGGYPHRGAFQYRARVSVLEPDENNGAAFLVRLKVSWHYWCGMRCAFYVQQDREVTVSACGGADVLAALMWYTVGAAWVPSTYTEQASTRSVRKKAAPIPCLSTSVGCWTSCSCS